MVDIVGDEFKLLFIIVKKDLSRRVIKAVKKGGAEGGTIISGRGSGIHEKAKLFSFTIEPEKDIVLTLVPADRTEKVLDAIVTATKLNEPGHGIAFVLDVEKTTGINHLIE